MHVERTSLILVVECNRLKANGMYVVIQIIQYPFPGLLNGKELCPACQLLFTV
jgi:hypothetical protein